MASSCHVCMPSTLRSSRAARHSCISTCETTLKVCKGSSATYPTRMRHHRPGPQAASSMATSTGRP
ncbi:hypothetical protein GY15_22180 [Delftia sp. 670]|nr:hypothetical protein GY15_22180 [Delftia sp. 670]